MSENKPQQALQPQPSIGRMVHFVYGTQHVPAIITQVDCLVDVQDEPTGWFGQALVVFLPLQPPFTTVAKFNAEGESGTWHWPEYVPAK